MSVIVQKAPIQWTETAIRDGALKFLSDKNEQLNECIRSLKTATMENGDIHTQPTKLARERVCKLAIEARKETNHLQYHAVICFNKQYLADPESDETKYLAKIALAAQTGLSYFNDIAASSRSDYSSSLALKFFKKIDETWFYGASLMLGLPFLLHKFIPVPPHASLSYINMTQFMNDNPNANLSHIKDINSYVQDVAADEFSRRFQQAGVIICASYIALSMTSTLITSRFPSSRLPTPAEIHLKHLAFSKALAPAAN